MDILRKISHIILSAVLAFGLSGCFLLDDEEETVNHTIDSTLEQSEAVRSKNVNILGNGEDTVTVLVYMNGSNLESDDGEASEDLQEMINAGSKGNVNVVVQTMGTKKWQSNNIANNRSQIYELDGSGMTLVKDDLGQLDCTDPSTLSSFVKWGAQNYPANRYVLLFWDHGSGPVLGFGYDEYNEEGYLSTDEIQSALKNAGVYFDWIGMDCCIMSAIEVGCALYDYCDYLIVSEDFESGLGWYYTDWMKQLRNNTSISTPDLSKTIIDTMIEANETSSDGSESILTCLDVSMMKVLFQAWTDFAYANEDALLDENYSQQTTMDEGGKVDPRFYEFSYDTFDDWFSDDNVTLSEYFITDVMAVAQNIDSDESSALSSAVAQTIVYSNCTSGDSYLTGIAVTLPYGDTDYYNTLKTVFANIGIDSDYITWLKKFTTVSGSSYYDYSDWDDDWTGWDNYEDDYDWDSWDGWDKYDDDYWLLAWAFSFFNDSPHYDSYYYDEDYYYDDYDEEYDYYDEDWDDDWEEEDWYSDYWDEYEHGHWYDEW